MWIIIIIMNGSHISYKEVFQVRVKNFDSACYPTFMKYHVIEAWLNKKCGILWKQIFWLLYMCSVYYIDTLKSYKCKKCVALQQELNPIYLIA
jgi:hypothetical protein